MSQTCEPDPSAQHGQLMEIKMGGMCVTNEDNNRDMSIVHPIEIVTIAFRQELARVWPAPPLSSSSPS